jgi:thiol-disulfide isomerase/thioredoxin
MKKILLLIALVTLACCDEMKHKEVHGLEEAILVERTTEIDDKIKAKIPSLDFSEFNKYLTKENDTTYVVNFWATWCRPCIKELPAFEKLTVDYLDKKVKVLLVSLDFPDKIDSQVVPFLEKNNIQSQVLLLDDGDANSWIPKVSEKWSGAIPATLIYNKNTRLFYERSFTFEELQTELNTFIKNN